MKQRLFLFIAILLTLISCSGDNDPDNEKNGGGSSNKDYLTVKVNIPVNTELQTYALTDAEESELKEVDVLIFNQQNNKYISHQVGTDITDAAGAQNGNKKEFKIKIEDKGVYNSIYLMVIGNAHNEIEAAKTSGIIGTAKTKDDIMKSLVFDCKTDASAGDDKWLVKPGIYTRFPMFGISNNINLNVPSGSPITVEPVTLIRSVAKIDVGVNFNSSNIPLGIQNPTSNNTFKIENVYLYNSHKKLMVAPNPANWAGAGAAVTAPSLPNTPGTFPVMKYTMLNSDIQKLGMLNTIYMPEHAKGTIEGRANNLCIVVGGYFTEKNRPENTTTLTYYRIDFIKSTKDLNDNITQEFLPILRNHRYRVNIKSVKEPGYATAVEAFNSIGSNIDMMVDILIEEESINEMVYDGEYMMGIEQKSFLLAKTAKSGVEVSVKTTHPRGWKAVVKEGNPWLTLDQASAILTTAGTKKLKFNVQANGTNVSRTGKLLITSGNMSMTIEVKQEAISPLEIESPKEYYLMDGSVYNLKIKSAFAWQVKVKNDRYNILSDFDKSGLPDPSGNRSYTFKIVDDMINARILYGTATLTFFSLDGSFPEQDVTIRARSAYDFGDVLIYPIDQKEGYTWYVYSNTPENLNENSVPPASGTQSDPPRANSCASLHGSETKPWRLPTLKELKSIFDKLQAENSFDTYKFRKMQQSNDYLYYLSATSDAYPYQNETPYSQVHVVQFSSTPRNPNIGVSSSKACNQRGVYDFARCVKSK